MTAKVVAENDKRISLTRDLPCLKDKAGQVVPRFQYRASYDMQTRTFMVSAVPNGYGNNFRGFGTCEIKYALQFGCRPLTSGLLALL